MISGTLVSVVVSALGCAGLAYFFLVTRGTLIARSFLPCADDRFHVYWVYSHMPLIRFSDRKPWVAAVLLFQYDRLVARVVSEIRRTALAGKTFLMTSCAFGDVMPRVVGVAAESGAERIWITDLIENELIHAARKLPQHPEKLCFSEADARNMPQRNGEVQVNLIFFLLHELPDSSKERALLEAARVVAPGGKLIVAEFHRPRVGWMRVLGKIYFSIFEPYALSMWGEYDPVGFLEKLGGWHCRRSTYFFGNFQVLVAMKQE